MHLVEEKVEVEPSGKKKVLVNVLVLIAWNSFILLNLDELSVIDNSLAYAIFVGLGLIILFFAIMNFITRSSLILGPKKIYVTQKMYTDGLGRELLRLKLAAQKFKDIDSIIIYEMIQHRDNTRKQLEQSSYKSIESNDILELLDFYEKYVEAFKIKNGLDIEVRGFLNTDVFEDHSFKGIILGPAFKYNREKSKKK